jgi:hypothetical protein
VEGQAVKRLALLALRPGPSSIVAAPAPLAKPQGKVERPGAAQQSAVVVVESSDEVVGVNFAFMGQQGGGPPPVPVAVQPAQPPNADPPG